MVSFLGGFFISILKRRKELKDAGHLLPGHGGILDRFDSVFFVVFFVWALMLYPHRSKITLENLKQAPQKIVKKIKGAFWKGKKVAVKALRYDSKLSTQDDRDEKKEEGGEEAAEKTMPMIPEPKKKDVMSEKKAMPMAPVTEKKESALRQAQDDRDEEDEEEEESPKKLVKMPGT